MQEAPSARSAGFEHSLIVVLRRLAECGRALRADEIAGSGEISRARALRCLKILAHERLAAYDDVDGGYRVGPELLRLSSIVRARLPLTEAARPAMRQLAAQLGETVTLNAYFPGGRESVCVAVEESAAPLHYVLEVGESKPLHGGASGRAILAALPDSAVLDIIRHTGLPAITERTISDEGRLWAEIRRTRSRGYAFSRGERLPGAVAVAAPVLTTGGDVAGSLVITTPSYRFRPADRPRFAKEVMRAAHDVSALLGGPA